MNFEALLAQYHMQQTFYAGEVAYRLAAPKHITITKILRGMQQLRKPTSLGFLLGVLEDISEVVLRARASWLEKHGLLVCIGTSQQVKVYRLSDFALCVLSYLDKAARQRSDERSEVDFSSDEAHGKCDYDWAKLDPEIKRGLDQGKPIRQISKEYHIVYGTLQRHIQKMDLSSCDRALEPESLSLSVAERQGGKRRPRDVATRSRIPKHRINWAEMEPQVEALKAQGLKYPAIATHLKINYYTLHDHYHRGKNVVTT